MPRSFKRKHRKQMKGGYTSATTYGEAVNGSVDSQINRVNSAPGPANNAAIGTEGQRAGGRKMRRSSVKRGGFWGVINQAVVPFAILGMQQSYRKRSNHRGGTRKRKHSSRKH